MLKPKVWTNTFIMMVYTRGFELMLMHVDYDESVVWSLQLASLILLIECVSLVSVYEQIGSFLIIGRILSCLSRVKFSEPHKWRKTSLFIEFSYGYCVDYELDPLSPTIWTWVFIDIWIKLSLFLNSIELEPK